MPTFKAGLVGATGALGLDAAWGFIAPKLPAALANPYVQYAVKILASVAVGFVGGKVLKGKGAQLALGGATVATHDLLKSVLQGAIPGVFGPGGSVSLGAYLSGAAPIIGTATFPQSYLPMNGWSDSAPANAFGDYGAYMSGGTGMNDGAGTFTDDMTGY